MSTYIPVDKRAKTSELLPAVAGLPEIQHRFDEPSLHAINVALAAGRPLLVRGEPGTGKSQLARAAAFLLDRQYAWRVMDAQTKISDLFYDFDAVGRLAHAQLVGALCHVNVLKTREEVDHELDELRFVRPGPLWWAFDAATARECPMAVARAKSKPEAVDERPYVVLIDEIDKTDSSVPNGLLEALGQGTFSVLGDKVVVSLHAPDRPPPLVIITTNDERELPAAFVRRCLVHYIRVPEPGDTPSLQAWLCERGRTHFPVSVHSDDVLGQTALLVERDRIAAKKHGLSAPGQAEYLDLLRALAELGKDEDDAGKLRLLGKIKNLALKKHPDLYEHGAAGGGG